MVSKVFRRPATFTLRKRSIACVEDDILRGDRNGALADYNRVLALNPKEPVGYNNRGRVREVTGDLNGAMADYNRAIALNPRYGLVYRNRGNLKQRRGDTNGAIADFNQALKLGVSTAPPAP